MSTILNQARVIEGKLREDELVPTMSFCYQNLNKIVYHRFDTSKGNYFVKYDYEYFNSFGRLYSKYSGILGDSFDSQVVDLMKSGDMFVFCKKEGIFTVSYDVFMKHAIRRKNKSTLNTTYSIPITIFKRWL